MGIRAGIPSILDIAAMPMRAGRGPIWEVQSAANDRTAAHLEVLKLRVG
jgi:hypothetical protein